MAITVNGPNGVTINFPDGTDPDTINRAMSEAIGGKSESKPVEPTGNIAAGLEGVGQGLSFGFGDEIEGAARALYQKYAGGQNQRSFGELYDESIKVPRERIRKAQQTNPLAFYGGEIGSALVVPGSVASLGMRGAVSGAAHAGLGARSLASAKQGAVYGGLYGAGTAEGGIQDRLNGAGTGAVTGAALGAAMPGAVDVLGAVGQRAAAPFRAAMNPKQAAAEKMSEAIARDLSEIPGQAGNSAERFADRFGNMTFRNTQSMAMDAGGENVRGLMRSAYNMPNPSREAMRRRVDTRQANQATRIEDSLTWNMGDKGNFYESVQTLAQKMDEIGANQIQPSLARETPMTTRLASVLDRPTTKELRQLVERKIADEGQPQFFQTNTQMIHRLKMELDDQIGIAKRAEKMGNKPQAGWDVRTLTILKRDLLNAVDNDAYKAGLKNYAGQARLSNAAEDGYDGFMKSQPEEIRGALRALETEAERDLYRLGATRALVEKIRKGNVNNDRTDGMFSSPEIQKKMRELFPDNKSRRQFQAALVVEAKMADSRKALQGNSTTAKQLAEGGEAGKTATGITSLMNAASGRIEPMLNLLAQGYNRFSGLTPKVAGEILEMGMSRDPQRINALARRGMEQASQVPMARAGRADALTAAGGTFGGSPMEVTVYPPGDPRNRF